MTEQDFKVVLEQQIERIRCTLGKKAKEYANKIDTLRNFKLGANLLRAIPEEVCLAYLTKHLVSVVDMVYGAELEPQPAEQWDEKIGDCLCYLILLRALVVEREHGEIE